MDVYATHMPMVAVIALKTIGPILEMGCGYYSTYILHEMCKLTARELVTLDEKLDWINKFKFLENNFHQIHFVKDWSKFSLIDNKKWGMVLIDHAPGERRIVDIDRLKNNADYLVIHDTEEAGYKYEPILKGFKYRFDYKLIRPWTTVVSNFYELDFLNG